MKKSNPARARSRTLQKVTPVAAAVAAVLCAPGAVFAQAAAPAAPDEVVTITGIRRPAGAGGFKPGSRPPFAGLQKTNFVPPEPPRRRGSSSII